MTGLEIYKLVFITEILVAEALFTFRLTKRKLFPLRVLGVLAVSYLAAFFYPVKGDYGYTSWYASLMFFALFLVTFFGLVFLYKISVKKCFFCAVAAYTAQHLSYEIFRLMSLPFDLISADSMYGNAIFDSYSLNGWTVVAAFIYLDVNLAVLACAYFLLGRRLGKGGDFELKNVQMLLLAFVILLVDIILNAVVVYIPKIEGAENVTRSYDIIVGVYNVMCCILVFYLMRKLLDAKDAKDEIRTISHLLKQAEQQYAMKKEEIDLINIKCHDLKYQLGRFAARGELDERTISEMTELISIYDTTVETGNEVLDIILTEKSLKCHREGIKLTCMANCADLAFVGEGELYALFGNILDNAIEAASMVRDEEKKCIGVNVHTVGKCVSIMAENYYEGAIPTTQDGFLRTSKKDAENHGFGIKSVRAIVEKYGGDLTIQTEENIFRIAILLPIPERAA